MQFWGEPGNLSFPELCPNCGNSAKNRLTYTKTFYRASGTDTPNSYFTTLIRVPFCDACISRHRVEGPGPSLLMNLLSRLLTLAQGLGVLSFGLAAGVAAYYAFIQFQRQHLSIAASLGALALFTALVAKGMYGLMRDGTENMRAEKQSGMTLAFDFSDSIAAPFESIRFDCSMRNEAFAKAFRKLNHAAEYIPGNPVALADQQNARKKFWKIAVVVAAIAIYGIVKELFE
jgi:hypothetical protein